MRDIISFIRETAAYFQSVNPALISDVLSNPSLYPLTFYKDVPLFQHDTSHRVHLLPDFIAQYDA